MSGMFVDPYFELFIEGSDDEKSYYAEMAEEDYEDEKYSDSFFDDYE